MDEDDELSAVHRHSAQSEGVLEGIGEEELATAEKSRPVTSEAELKCEEPFVDDNSGVDAPVPDTKGAELITEAAVPKVKVAEPNDEETITPGDFAIPDDESRTKSDVMVKDSPKDIELIPKEEVPMVHAEKHSETDVSVGEPEELPTIRYGENNLDTEGPVVDPKDEECEGEEPLPIGDGDKHTEVTIERKDEEQIIEEGFTMSEMHTGRDSWKMETEVEAGAIDTEVGLSEGGIRAEAIEPKDEERITEEGFTMAEMPMGMELGNMETVAEDGAIDTEVEPSVGEIRSEAIDSKDEERITEDGFTMAEMHLGMESGNMDTAAEDGVIGTEVELSEGGNRSESNEPKDEEQTEKGSMMAEMHMVTESEKMETVVEVGRIDTEVEVSGGGIKLEAVALGSEADEVEKEEVYEAEAAMPESAMAESEATVAGMEAAETEGVNAETDVSEAEEETETEMADVDTETELAEVETEMEMADVSDTKVEATEGGRAGGGKRKRGRNSKVPVRVPQRKKVEEDVCFICFDGGELVLCDRRGCPKAYHPSCVNRDEAFFRAKGRWNCGWHICSICEKNAYYMCYTCTYSLCKGCIKNAVILCVRGNKGFCETCMKTVLLIERNEQGKKEMGQVDFDDKNSWEYLFKDYWIDLKGRLSLTSDELSQAKNPWKAPDIITTKHQDSLHNIDDADNEAGSGSDRSENLEASKPRRRKGRRLSKSFPKEADLPLAMSGETADPAATEWASKELLEFVMHMKNGDGSVLSQFDVQALLLDYIKRNKLRDPRRKSQIICDSRLENLFGKARVGHFEMLKLLESHFLMKKDSQADNIQGNVVDTEASLFEGDDNADILTKSSKDRKRKMRKKGDRGRQSNLEEYAAIDMHNINLIYLRRNLMEDLLGDNERLHDKVVGSFVRIRISGSGQKQDIYRLVQVVGTSKAVEPYRVGKRTTDFMLEILNLNKVEVISIDIISNQDFTEDECKRLRQSIKCGLINRLTVGDVLERAMALHAVRVNDWMETEIVRLSHLRDRASEKGRRKELRECVEKLQLLKTAGERQRRLEEIPEVHADANMDPSHESEEEEDEDDLKRQEVYTRPRTSGFDRRGREPMSPASNDSWSGGIKNPSKNWELSRNLHEKDRMKSGEDSQAADMLQESARGRDRNTQQSNTAEKLKTVTKPDARDWSGPHPAVVTQSAAKVSETDKIWHYQDPSGKVQGPFSMVQLRKWSKSGYFPVDLRIWKATEKKDDSLLLTDALFDFFPIEQPSGDGGLNSRTSSSHSSKPFETSLPKEREVQGGERMNPNESVKLHNPVGSTLSPAVSRNRRGSDCGGSNELLNLPSPTPSLNTTGGNGSGPNSGLSPFSGGNGLALHPSLIVQSGTTDQSSPTPLTYPSVSHGSTSQQSRTPEYKEQSMVDIVLPPSGSNSRIFLSSANESQGVQPNIRPHPSADIAGSLMDAASDAMKASADLPNAVQSVTPPNPTMETHGWAPGSVSVPMPIQQSSYGQWAPPPPVPVNPSLSFNAVNPAGSFPMPAPPSIPWRPPGNQLETGSNVQAPPPQGLPWSMGIVQNQSAAPNLQPENPNPAWGPNMNWVGQGPAPGAPNMNWVGQGPVPGAPNMNWGPALQGHSAPQGPAPVSANMNWGPVVGQGPLTGTPNPNMNWGAPAQGPVPGNANPGWVGPTVNAGMYGGGNQNQNGDRFRRDGGFQGGDNGQGSGRPWNSRQPSFGGGGSRVPPNGNRDRVCRFHENGHCKKGADCNYLHP